MDESRTRLVSELARAIGAVAAGDDEEATRIIRALAGSAETQPPLPGFDGPTALISVDEARKKHARELFAYWQRECGHEAAKMTPERVVAILARLRDGYSPAEIRKAIDGAKHGAFVSPDNGKRHDDLTLICRNGAKLEDFIARGEKHTGAIVVDEPSTGGVEEQIVSLRRSMVELRRAGRVTEYEAANNELKGLMARRAAR